MGRLSLEPHESATWEGVWGPPHATRRRVLHDPASDLVFRSILSDDVTRKVEELWTNLATYQVTDPTSAATKAELDALRRRLEELQERVKTLESERAETVLTVREVNRKDAKAELLAFFQQRPDTFPSDAAIALGFDPALVRDLAAELVSDGLLEG